jgi:NAD+ kinase
LLVIEIFPATYQPIFDILNHMHSVGFYVNTTKPQALAVRERLEAFAVSCGLEVCAENAKPDFVVVLGGDGTILSAVHVFRGIPLLGLNLGSLGYLAGVEEPNFEDAIKSVSLGNFSISYRTALQVCGVDALNDVVISRGVSGHAVTLELEVDGHLATRFHADGLIIATPTGSTAYSLAAGGPIILPDSETFVITPICPHALSCRPLVVRDSAILTVRAIPNAEDKNPINVFSDGEHVVELSGGKVVQITKSNYKIPLIQLPGYEPCELLGRKLGWSGTAITRK